MSNSHKGSKLILKDALIPVDYSSAHFDYNVDATGIKYGNLIEPTAGSIYTMRPNEGKFGGGVSVEEGTTNLLYDNGVYNSSFSGLTITPTVTTITPNNRYKIVTPTGNTGQIRLSVPLSKLTNGATYNLSYKYKILKGTIFKMTDWCDSTITALPDSVLGDYRFSSAYGMKATYDSTYRFMDFDISADTDLEIWDIQLEQKTFATSFVNGTRQSGYLPYDRSLLNTNSFTVNTWVNISILNGGNGNNPIIELGADTSANGGTGKIYFFIQNGNLMYRVSNGTYSGSNSSFVVPLKQWTMCTLSFDGTNYRIYGNGVISLTQSNVVATIPSNAFLYVGGYNWGNLNGIMSDLVIHNRQLSDEEIMAMYISQKPVYNPYDYRAYSY